MNIIFDNQIVLVFVIAALLITTLIIFLLYLNAKVEKLNKQVNLIINRNKNDES